MQGGIRVGQQWAHYEVDTENTLVCFEILSGNFVVVTSKPSGQLTSTAISQACP